MFIDVYISKKYIVTVRISKRLNKNETNNKIPLYTTNKTQKHKL